MPLCGHETLHQIIRDGDHINYYIILSQPLYLYNAAHARSYHRSLPRCPAGA